MLKYFIPLYFSVIIYVARMTQNSEVMQFIIASIIINMVYVQPFYRSTKNTFVWKLSKSKSPITKFPINEIGVVFSYFIKRSCPGTIVALIRTKDVFCFFSHSLKLIATINAIFKSVWISRFIRAAYSTKNSFFRGVVEKLSFTNLTYSLRMMVKVVAFPTTVKRVTPLVSSYYKCLFTKVACFFHATTIAEQNAPSQLSTIKPRVLYGN